MKAVFKLISNYKLKDCSIAVVYLINPNKDLEQVLLLLKMPSVYFVTTKCRTVPITKNLKNYEKNIVVSFCIYSRFFVD